MCCVNITDFFHVQDVFGVMDTEMRRRSSAFGEMDKEKPRLRRTRSARRALQLKIEIPNVIERGSGRNAYHLYAIQVCKLCTYIM